MTLHPFKPLIEHTANHGMTAFPPMFKEYELEREMKQTLFLENKVKTRIALIMGMMALIIFAVIGNAFAKPDVARQLTSLRIGFDLTFLVLVFSLTYTQFGQKYFHQLLGMAIIWVSVTINLSNFVDETPVYIVQYYPALMLLLFFGYVFIRGNWYTAIATGAVVQVVFLLLSPLLNFPTSTLVVSNIYILSVNMVGAVGNYIIEYSTRREFWTRKQLELEQDKLKEANKALDNLIGVRTNELISTKAFMTNLNSGVATDLNAPIRSARGYLELLVNRNKENFDPTSWEIIEQIKKRSNKMMSMQASLVEYARLQESMTSHTPLDANMIVQTAIQGLKESIKHSEAEITVHALPSVEGDEIQLIMLFRNLLTNAIRFDNQSPPKILIEAINQPKDHHWLFSIKDNGAGIAKSDQIHLFEFFTRLNPEEERSGTGMGLAICKRIVELHGGEIWVESESEKGSTFYFTLKGESREE